MSLHLTTTIMRDEEERDVVIDFHVAHYVKGDPGRSYGEPGDCWPPEPPEYDFTVDDISFDPPHLPALSDRERGFVCAWFRAHHDDAVQIAEEERADDAVAAAEARAEMRRDEQMWEDEP